MAKKPTHTIRFDSEAQAQSVLALVGFSIGTTQRDAPRGLMFPDSFDVMKWRNLSLEDRAGLHGVYRRDFRDGPVTVHLFDTCPAGGIADLLVAHAVEIDMEAADQSA